MGTKEAICQVVLLFEKVQVAICQIVLLFGKVQVAICHVEAKKWLNENEAEIIIRLSVLLGGRIQAGCAPLPLQWSSGINLMAG